jgi:hypothetical protein
MLLDLWRDPKSIYTTHMNKILVFGRSCKSYSNLFQDRAPNVVICCDDCKVTMHKHGRYFRSVTTKQKTRAIPIYRWLCPICRKTLSLLPDFLVPWARFATYIREAAVIRKLRGDAYGSIAQSITAENVRVSRCTVKRWWKRHLHKASDLSLWLAGQLLSSGYTEDLLHRYPNPVASGPAETTKWLQTLLSIFSRKPASVRGLWSCLHSRIPRHLFL